MQPFHRMRIKGKKRKNRGPGSRLRSLSSFLFQYQTKHAPVYVYKHITQVQFHFYGVIQMPFWYTLMDDLVLV